MKALPAAQMTKHRRYIASMFARQYPGAKMVWLDRLKRVDEFMLTGRLVGSGERWRRRELGVVVYLPKSWREGVGYRIL